MMMTCSLEPDLAPHHRVMNSYRQVIDTVVNMRAKAQFP